MNYLFTNTKKQLTPFDYELQSIRYIQLRTDAVFYAMEHCIGHYEKIGIEDIEKECIENRTKTFVVTYKDFLLNQKKNFSKIFI